jgi:hypothetical protein
MGMTNLSYALSYFIYFTTLMYIAFLVVIISLNLLMISDSFISYNYTIFVGGFLNCAASTGMMFLLSSFFKNKQIAAELCSIIMISMQIF